MRTTVIIIGAGQAGLAMSRCLTDADVDHVVLERGRIGHTWRTERWDSLHLLTPNWMSRLPGGYQYRGDDPDGYLSSAQVVDYLAGYAVSFDAPVRSGVSVDRVTPVGRGYRVETSDGSWDCRAVVIATGAASIPRIPEIASDLPGRIEQLTTVGYKKPGQVPEGGVLVVGASASGLQLADELARSGREVTIAVGDHVRLPRTYRGRNIHWWLDATGQLDQRVEEIDDAGRTRRIPSLQLVGTPEQRTLDLNALTDIGVRLTGKFMAVSGQRAQFSGSLANMVANADLKVDRLLASIDTLIDENGLDERDEGPWRPRRTALTEVVTDIDLDQFASVVWATGYRQEYPFLDPSMLDGQGRLVHDQGILRRPGAYVLGLPFMRRRKSLFLDGVGDDARELSWHLLAHLGRLPSRRSSARLLLRMAR